jgi:ATP-dependent exoDNAse (exonuclease V) beta subunit
VHRALELIDLQQTPESALEKQLESLPQDLRGFIASADLADVAAQAKQVLQQMDNNGMLHELFERREYILGREIPVLLTPTDCNTDEDPLGAIVGTLDLLYRDPADGQLVVADFKSDQIPDAQALRRLAKAYKPQGELYCRAVEKLFPDEEPPRFELWFLRAGEISLAL